MKVRRATLYLILVGLVPGTFLAFLALHALGAGLRWGNVGFHAAVEAVGALARVTQLQGLLPICSYCKKIRNDRNGWQQLENYIGERSEAQFSHTICPDCFERVVRPDLENF